MSLLMLCIIINLALAATVYEFLLHSNETCNRKFIGNLLCLETDKVTSTHITRRSRVEVL